MIFISYASEDRSYAQELFKALKTEGLVPWMDKPPSPHQAEGLQVGQRWQQEIERVLNGADYIILVLSRVSVRKRGFVSYEFRFALDRMNTLPDDATLVLPVRKDECDVPDMKVKFISLKDLHWEDVPSEAIGDFAQRLRMQIDGSYP